MNKSTAPITIIEPKKGWIPIDLKEIRNYRELLYYPILMKMISMKFWNVIITEGRIGSFNLSSLTSDNCPLISGRGQRGEKYLTGRGLYGIYSK